MQILVYGGTIEGHKLAERLAGAGVDTVVCVATSYGEMVLPQMEHLTVLTGRLSVEEMRQLYAKNDFAAVIDATHPYAQVVTQNVRESLAENPIPKFRLEREIEAVEKLETEATGKNEAENADMTGKIYIFPDVASCAKALEKTEGNILLTTGSKDLSAFCENESVRSRITARVLPGIESIQICYENQLEGKQIIAMQGPFDEQMNLALLSAVQARTLVTKQTGRAGGLEEKLSAAKKLGINVFLIAKPHSAEQNKEWITGSFDEVLPELEKVTGKNLAKDKDLEDKSPQENSSENADGEKTFTDGQLHVTLAGIGPGSTEMMSQALVHALETCDLVFGAKRMLAAVQDLVLKDAKQYPYYLSRDILPVLKEVCENGKNTKKEIHAVILFSGDTGFFSGCEKMKHALTGLSDEIQTSHEIKDPCKIQIFCEILPGISSMSYLAAKAGISYQDACIISAHGIEESVWISEMKNALAENRKIFFLTSGPEDIRKIAGLMTNEKMILGYELSYPEEKVQIFSAKEVAKVDEPGLYAGFICPI